MFLNWGFDLSQLDQLPIQQLRQQMQLQVTCGLIPQMHNYMFIVELPGH